MLKFWVKLVKDNRLLRQHLSDIEEKSTKDMLDDGLKEACYALDLAHPIVQQKHLDDLAQYGFTRFLPDSFMEDVNFSRMEVRIFEEHPKKKHGVH